MQVLRRFRFGSVMSAKGGGAFHLQQLTQRKSTWPNDLSAVYAIQQLSSKLIASMSTVFGLGKSVLRTTHQPVEIGVGKSYRRSHSFKAALRSRRCLIVLSEHTKRAQSCHGCHNRDHKHRIAVFHHCVLSFPISTDLFLSRFGTVVIGVWRVTLPPQPANSSLSDPPGRRRIGQFQLVGASFRWLRLFPRVDRKLARKIGSTD